MTSDIKFTDAVTGRRSNYTITDESTIPDSKVQEIVEFAIKHAPSSYNVQSARAVILFGDKHKTFWNDIVIKHMKQTLSEEVWAGFGPRINGFAAGHGTVLFFEDEDDLKALGEKHPMIKGMIDEWSAHSQGMNQYVAWAALSAEGLGANLQHFNFHPGIVADAKKAFGLPDAWRLHAQLVFGKPSSAAQEKQFEPLEKRVKVLS